jgi:hypothetical protein
MPLSPKPLPRQASGENNSPRRFKIYFQDDAVRQRSQEAVQHLLTTAASSDASSTSALLAKKALKYRKVLDRMSGVDVTAPEFDASKFMGVDWCKTHNLKAYCARSQ